jgi:hypothetical protein
VYSEVVEMRRIAILVGVMVLGTAVAASAQVVILDQLRQWFSGGDSYSQGFRAGYSAGVADAANAISRNPGLVTAGVTQCTRETAFPTLVQFTTSAMQRWFAANGPGAIGALPVLSAYSRCGRDQGDSQK